MRLDEQRRYRHLARPRDNCDRRGHERFPGAPPYFPEAVHAECEAKLLEISRDIRHPDWDRASMALQTLRRRKPGRQRLGRVSVWASAPEAMMLGDVLRAAGCFPDALEALDFIAGRPQPPGVALDILPSVHERYLAEVDPGLTDVVAVLRDARVRAGLRRIFVRPERAAAVAQALSAIGGYRPTIVTLECLAARAAPASAPPAAA